MARSISSHLKNFALFGASTLLLAACGGGSSGGGGGGGSVGLSASSAPPPAILRGQTATQTQLTGSAIRANNTSISLVAVAGSRNGQTGGLTINDGQFNFVDGNGPDGAGIFRSGTARLTNRVGNTRSFDFVFPYVQIYNFNGQEFSSFGVAGIATNPANVPATGTATFRGDSTGLMIANLGATSVSFEGNSTVTADFGAGIVDVQMSGFSIQSTNAQPAIAPADTIRIDNMVISGNTFAGGNVTTSLRGQSVNLTGANTNSTSQGHFFGQDGAGRPDEVGGNTIAIGRSGAISATFIAD